MEFKTSTYQKIGVVYGMLVILILVAVGVRFWQGRMLKNAQTPTPNAKNTTTQQKPSYAGKIYLESTASSVKVGENVDVTIYFEAPGKKIDGIDVVLKYDPSIINSFGFSEFGYFKLFPRKDVDNQVGVVKVTALDQAADQSLGSDKVSLGIVHFQGQKVGVTQVSFDFVTGTTSKTTMTENATSQNILGSADGVTITVEP